MAGPCQRNRHFSVIGSGLLIFGFIILFAEKVDSLTLKVQREILAAIPAATATSYVTSAATVTPDVTTEATVTPYVKPTGTVMLDVTTEATVTPYVKPTGTVMPDVTTEATVTPYVKPTGTVMPDVTTEATVTPYVKPTGTVMPDVTPTATTTPDITTAATATPDERASANEMAEEITTKGITIHSLQSNNNEKEGSITSATENTNDKGSTAVAGLCLAGVIILIIAINAFIFFRSKLGSCTSQSGVFHILQMSPIKKNRSNHADVDVEAQVEGDADVANKPGSSTSLTKDSKSPVHQAHVQNGEVIATVHDTDIAVSSTAIDDDGGGEPKTLVGNEDSKDVDPATADSKEAVDIAVSVTVEGSIENQNEEPSSK